MSVLQTIICWAWITVGTFLYIGQLISTFNFPLAQRLGLQEKSENADPLVSRLELMAARWDLAVLWVPPVAGVLFLVDQALWPAACLIAGGVNLDAGGREWAKVAGLSAQGVQLGSARERAVIYGTFSFLIVTGLMGIAVGLAVLI